jgi:hypothetical protein
LPAKAQVHWQLGNTPYLTKSLSNETIKNVFVSTSGGNILVSGAVGGSPRVEVYVAGNNGLIGPSNQQIKKQLEEDYTLDVSVNNNELRVAATNKNKHNGDWVWNWEKALKIPFKIYVPKDIATDLETSAGESILII